MGAGKSAPSAGEASAYRPINDLEVLGRCAASGRCPGSAEREAFLRFRAHEAPTLSEAALGEAVAAVRARSFPAWPAPPSEVLANGGDVADRIRGLLFGAAVADACGLATEFLSQARAEEFYGAGFLYRPGCDPFPDTHRSFFPPGDWTDDTDQMLLILQSLLEHSGEASPTDFAGRLRRWARQGFQELGDRCGSGLGKTVGKVVEAAGFEENPSECAERVWRSNGCNLAANGAVMRAAVCGLPSFWSAGHAERVAEALCRVTHFDERCVASCVCVSVTVSLLLAGVRPEEAERQGVGCAERRLAGEHLEELRWYASPERHWDDLKLDDPRSIGYTFKALACGLLALRAPGPFEETIREVVRRGGDADTNAVVCGALLGCARGARSLPQDWVGALPYSAWLDAWAAHAVGASGL